MANPPPFGWLAEIEQTIELGNPREGLRKAREALLEINEAGLDHSRCNPDSPSHNEWGAAYVRLHEIIGQLGPRFDMPKPDSRPHFVEFDPADGKRADELSAQVGRGGVVTVRPKVI